MKPLAVLFDLDDTLAHRDTSIAAYARRFVDDFGARLPGADGDAVAHALATRLRWLDVPVAALGELEALLVA